MSSAGQGGTAGQASTTPPVKTYADYDECSCDTKAGKFSCKNHNENVSYVNVDPAPTCTCNGHLECTDLRYDYPESMWMVIECSGTSTKGEPSFGLWYQGATDVQPYQQNTLRCGQVYNLLKDGNYFLIFKEGGVEVDLLYPHWNQQGYLTLSATLQ